MKAKQLFYAGERLRCIDRSEWGLGQVLEDTTEAVVDVFFEYLGRKAIDSDRVKLSRVETGRQSHPILDVLLKDLNWRRAHHNVYVVLLDKASLNHKSFREANPYYACRHPCIYVGLTGLDPEARFLNHKRGYKSNFYVEKYGICLLQSLYRSFNPMPYRLAQVVETHLANRFRSIGYGVWQH